VGVTVNTIFFKNLNITGTGGDRTLKVGACNNFKKYQGRVSGFLEILPTSERGGAVQLYFKSQYLMHRSR